MTKLLLLGLDGGDLSFIQRREAFLPFLSSRIKAERVVSLNTPEALSGSVWPTFYNGAAPGVHGVYQHLIWDAKRMGVRRIGTDWCYYRPFWQELEEDGYRSVVLDVPYSFPTALKKGVEITDWGTHGQTWPLACNQRQAAKIIRCFGKSIIGRETPIAKTTEELSRIFEQLIESTDQKGKLILELMEKLDWDFFVTIFAETHRGGHIFYCDEDEKQEAVETELLKIYQKVDQVLEKICQSIDDNVTVVIFSVHGMATDYAQGHFVRPLMDKINRVFLEQYCQIVPKSKVKASSLVPYLRKIVPSRLQYLVGAASPDWFRQWVVEKEITGGLDWSQTPGFALRTDIRTELRLNLIGRESRGFLERGSERHYQYVEFLQKALLELEDQTTKEKLVEKVVDTHRIFPGDRNEGLPDYVITWHPKPAIQKAYSPLLGEIVANPPEVRGGDHTDHGFVILPNELQSDELKHIKDLATFCKNFFAGSTL